MTSDLEIWRTRTLRNNLSWLEQFGCSVREDSGLLLVEHPELEDYNAWMVYVAPDEALEGLRAMLAAQTPDSLGRPIYVEHDSHSAAVEACLKNRGYKVAGTTITMSAIWRGAQSSRAWVIAGCDDLDQWAALHSQALGRSDEEAAATSRRWKASADIRSGLRFWSIERDQEPVGVCQTHDHALVTGLFSLVLMPWARGHVSLQQLARMVFVSAGVEAGSVVYYERERSSTSYQPISRTPRKGPFRPLRRMSIYRRLTSTRG